MQQRAIGHRVAEAIAHAATAVEAADALLSGPELIAASVGFADSLSEVGCMPGELVAVCLPRSAALIVAQLGCWQAGVAYVALDPQQPGRRLTSMLHDSGARFAVVDAAIELPDLEPVAWIAGVGLLSQLESAPVTTHEPGLAYVMYTSGSSGTPKGVMVEQAGLANLIDWHGRSFNVQPGDRCSQIASPGFDASAWEIWGTLANGGTLVVLPEELKTEPGQLKDWLVDQRIAVAFLPTLLAESVLDLNWPADGAMRTLLTGGDRLRRRPACDLPFDVVNNYGVTEASVVSTSGHVIAGGPDAPAIGSAIDGVQLRVVAHDGSTAATGERGELWVGGISVARGYLGPAELTTARFVDAPGDSGESIRWYLTGDRVWADADGQIFFQDRVDDQVEVAGRRIEPVEVMRELDRHGSVAASFVIGVDGQLVAYVRTTSGLPLDEHALRDHLSDRLPNYMIPAAFVQVSEFPMSASGKVDRSALPSPRLGGGNDEPADELEVAVAEMIGALLDRETVGKSENFMLLGGHSLLGAQLVNRLADQFGVELSLRLLFRNPTPAGIAEQVRRLLIEQVSQLDDETATQLIERG